jgi:hypothetical protein
LPHHIVGHVAAVDEHPEPVQLSNDLLPEPREAAVGVIARRRVRPGQVVVVGKRHVRRAEASELIDRVLDSLRAKGPSDTSHAQLPVFAEVLVELDRSDEFAESVARMNHSPWVSAAETYIDGRYAEAADLYRTLSVADEAWAHVRAARSLLEAGARADADVQLQKALVFFRSVGATRSISEGEALLAATA